MDKETANKIAKERQFNVLQRLIQFNDTGVNTSEFFSEPFTWAEFYCFSIVNSEFAIIDMGAPVRFNANTTINVKMNAGDYNISNIHIIPPKNGYVLITYAKYAIYEWNQ